MYDIKVSQPSKPYCHRSSFSILVLSIPPFPQRHCFLIGFVRGICANQDQIRVHNVARVAFDADLLDNIGQIPLCVFWNEAHLS